MVAAEETRVHTRLLNSGLLLDESRAYWRHRLETPDAELGRFRRPTALPLSRQCRLSEEE